MSDNTFLFLLALTDKVGHPIVSLTNGVPTIWGKPVQISPNMDDIGASNVPVLFGAFDRFIVHCAKNQMFAKRFDEAPNLVEKGQIAYRLFARYDGKLLCNDATSSPINFLKNHS
jgi:HK97 family phage major capsid protein